MKNTKEYETVRTDGGGYFKEKRGLIKVSGAEAEMFLNGLITNDVVNFEDFTWKSAAFPNAQGRTLAIVRVLKIADNFLFETEDATYKKVLSNLERFTLAGDFKVDDLTDELTVFSARGETLSFKFEIPKANEIIEARFGDQVGYAVRAVYGKGFEIFVPRTVEKDFEKDLTDRGEFKIGEKTRDILRIENGAPLYGIDVDETTIVPEINTPELINYKKGCYIGQEIIARIHFRGHVAKKLTGLIFEDENAAINPNDEIKSFEGKNAGRVTSVAYSPKLEKHIALAYVRYDYLAAGTILKVNDFAACVRDLPFVE